MDITEDKERQDAERQEKLLHIKFDEVKAARKALDDGRMTSEMLESLASIDEFEEIYETIPDRFRRIGLIGTREYDLALHRLKEAIQEKYSGSNAREWIKIIDAKSSIQ